MKKIVLFCLSLSLLSSAHATKISVEDAHNVLVTNGRVQARYEVVNVSDCDPKEALNSALEYGLKNGVADFLQSDNFKTKYAKSNKFIIDTAGFMSTVFAQGKLHTPTKGDLKRPYLMENVLKVYDILLKNFLWENEHSTEVTADEVAAHLVLRAQLKQLQALWQ